ncbi:MAG: hypothetical protein JKY19_11655 [Alcanivoracaceae bacterium]|nr:hypothetical protein [Alcanivoracaceae bacterium]
MAKYRRPKIIGELKIICNMAGGLSIHNGLKQGKNKIMLSCRSEAHCLELIEKLKSAKPFEIIQY